MDIEKIFSMLSESISSNENIKSIANKEEIEIFTKLCMLGVLKSNNENPKDLIRKLSDPLVEYVVKNLNKLNEIKVLKAVGAFFVLEWCWRNDYLLDDWLWEWKTTSEGQIYYNPRIPLESVPLPKCDS